MSLGGGSATAITRDGIQAIADSGVLVFAAAGNGGNSAYLYPASYPAVISIAATNSSDLRASFSQYNDEVDLAAPGVGVLSTEGEGYGTLSGTSMACPHASGVA